MVSVPKESWVYNVFAKYFTKTCEDRVGAFDFKLNKSIRMTCILLVAKLDNCHKKKLHVEMLGQSLGYASRAQEHDLDSSYYLTMLLFSSIFS